jgi:3-oxoacyl-[acyl-carrier protein] reductase
VALSGSREAPLAALAAELGTRAHVLVGNLASAEEAEGLVKRASDLMGGVDILVNNAGITRDGLMMRMSDEDWLSVIDVNLNAVFRLSRAALRGMMKARWGRIINITSVVAQAGNPGQANYAAAKAGVAGMSRSLAQEVASRNITVNCVAPGLIETAMTEKLTEEQRGRILADVPAGRMGRPEEVAAAVLYLASEEAAYVTGATLDVNGGGDML